METLTIRGITLPVAEWNKRFWAKVDQEAVQHPDDCWEWTGSKNSQGYGKLMFKTVRKTIVAHRLSFKLFDPEFDYHSNLLVCHRCDNPSCVNFAHLFLGTVADNNKDAFQKGRNAIIGTKGLKGERHGRAKLTEEVVREMRRLYDQGWSVNALSDRFGASRGGVYSIVNYLTWKHIA